MAASQDDGEEITGINVTPLVDVMLVLLVIFMVTASYIVNQTIKVSLPKASSGEQSSATNLAFVLDRESKLFLDGKSLDYSEIDARIAEYKAQGKPLQALIAADESTPHGAVVKLIDVVRRNGIFDFAINIEVQQQ